MDVGLDAPPLWPKGEEGLLRAECPLPETDVRSTLHPGLWDLLEAWNAGSTTTGYGT